MQAIKEGQDISKVLKNKNLQPRILYPARLSFRIEGEINNFSDKQKLKEDSNTKSILKEILRSSLNRKEAGINKNGKLTRGKANI